MVALAAMVDHMDGRPYVWCVIRPLMVCEATFQRKCSSWASRYRNFAGTLGVSACGACNGYVCRCYRGVSGSTYCECERTCFCFLSWGAGAPDPGGGRAKNERSKTLHPGNNCLTLCCDACKMNHFRVPTSIPVLPARERTVCCRL